MWTTRITQEMLASGKPLKYKARVPISGLSLVGWFEFLLTLEPAGDGAFQVYVEETHES